MSPVADRTAVASLASSRRLDKVVDDICDRIPEPAILVNSEHRIIASNAAFEVDYGDGRRASGRFCFRAMHQFARPCGDAGVGCPLEQCRSTGRTSRVAHVHQTANGMKQEEVICLPIGESKSANGAFLLVIRPIWITRQPGADRRIELVGRSACFNTMMGYVSRVAESDVSVLLQGESGTGKELVASLIHSLSPRSHRAFVPLDCSGLAESLFESELFGHEKGAFTGATSNRIGLVETCQNGTLFLDEVGDIPPTLQAKLLRLLETGTFRRVGSAEQRHCDFRLICATNRDLRELVTNGSFRQDLYHRISMFPIVLPPLRERVGDLPVLIDALTSGLHCPNGCHLDDGAMNALSGYAFPGNVRELLNVLHRACLLTRDGVIRVEDLPPEIRSLSAQQECEDPGGILPLCKVEHRYLRWAAAAFPGCMRDLAKRLGVTERTLYRKLRNAGSTPRGRVSNRAGDTCGPPPPP